MLMAVALVGLGVTMIYSASGNLTGTSDSWKFWQDPGLKQLVFVPPALILMWLASHVPYRLWRIQKHWYLSPTVWLFIITVGLLAAVLVAPASLAPRINGAKRWFKLGGGFSLQPSELAKVAVVLLLAALLADTRYKARSFLLGLIPLLVLTVFAVLPVVKEDFGTAVLIAAVAGCLLIAGRPRSWQVLMFFPPAAFAGYLFIITSPYRVQRFMQWWQGAGEDTPAGYHIAQSLRTIASGDWFGRGLGDGLQKWGFLPESTTDFIFPNVCEELGIIGGLIVIGLFIVLVWLLFRAMRAAPDLLGQLIVLGVMLTIGLQAAMNVAVVTGSVPTKGIALPFVSAGGSGLIITSIALGLAANVARTARRKLATE